jgi:modification methylase
MGSVVRPTFGTDAATRAARPRGGGGAERPLNRVLEQDCVTGLNALPAGSVDMIFADPPYNLQLAGELHRPNNTRVDGVDDAWDQFDDLAAYDAFCRKWLTAARHALKDDGTIWVIGSYHNIYRLGALLQDMGFWILNDVVWRKTNPMPNFRGRRFTNAHETLIWAAKSPQSKYTFNYQSMKALNDDLQMRSDWTLPICSGQERLKDRRGKKLHPTQKPEALLHRIVLAATRPEDLVVDPFMGSGTTGAVAKRLGRRWLGFELDADYAAAARKRIESVVPVADPTLVAIESKREAPRVPFGWLVERGLVQVGDLLVGGPGNRYTAKVRADGTVISAEHKGSIHQVGAAVQGAPSCNGWTFWQLVQADGTHVPLDALRQKLRAELS